MHDKDMSAQVIVGLTVLGVVVAGVFLLGNVVWKSSVRSYEDCINREQTIKLSNPQQRCIYRDGQTFDYGE